ncbi:hypothetical protein [Bacillus smithii]
MKKKIKTFLANIGVCDSDMSNLDEDELCELAIHMLHPNDLFDFLEMVNE